MVPPRKKDRRTRSKRRERKIVPQAQVHITSTFNNTILTITDQTGNTLTWASCGTAGFRGARKGTPFAAQLAAQQVARQAADFGVRQVDVFVKGPGAGRDAAIRALQSSGLAVTSITDVTPIPHNGCRPRKRRRV